MPSLVRPVVVALVLAVPTAQAIAAAPTPSLRRYEGPTGAPVPTEPPPVAESAPVVPPRLPPRPTAWVAAKQPAGERSTEIRVRPALDLTITLGAAAPSFALALWVEPGLPDRNPTPGDDAGIKKIDRIALGRFERAPAIASDVLLGVSIVAPFVVHAIEAGVRRRGASPVRGRGFLIRYGTNVLLLAEALAVNSLITQVLKTAIRRPRPYTYLDPAEVDPSDREALMDAQSRGDADWSFPSGHTSTAFTILTASATLLTLELLGRSRWAIAVAWVGGISLASTTAVLRVAAGRHFTSDVLTSAVLGAGIGAAVPLAHWRPVPSGDYARLRPRNWTLMPASGRGYAGASLIVQLP